MSRILQPTATEPLQGERRQPDLDGPRVVEPGVRLEVDVQPLGQRLQPLDALRAVKEGRCAGDRAGTGPGNRPASTSSMSCRRAFRPLSRTSPRTR